MPRVRLTTDRACFGATWRAGDVIDVSPEEARRLVESQAAVPEPEHPEQAVRAPQETACRRPKRKERTDGG
ncbi:MAG: hypothetical protein ACOY3P_06990 [Planctomycetota bacterium]